MQKTKKTDTELERYHADVLWFDDHYKELKSLYPDQWVGVYNKEVVGAHEDAEFLLEYLHCRNVPIENTFFDFVHTEEKIWVFTPIFQ